MADDLEPCVGCQRHVRDRESACPFCGAPRLSRVRVEELRLLNRLDRGTLVALGAALSAAGIAIGCREAATAPVAIYGAPAPSAELQPAGPPAELPAAGPSASSSASGAGLPPLPPPSASAPPSIPAAVYGAPPNIRLEPESPPPPHVPKK